MVLDTHEFTRHYEFTQMERSFMPNICAWVPRLRPWFQGEMSTVILIKAPFESEYFLEERVRISSIFSL